MSHPYHKDHPNVVGPDIVNSTPDLPDLQQEAPTFDVKGAVQVTNAVRVYELPSRHATGRSYKLVELISQPLLGADKRRKRVTIIGIAPTGTTSIGFYIGTQDDVRAGMATLWPYNQPLVLQHTEAVYVMPHNTSLADGHYISFVAENWAD